MAPSAAYHIKASTALAVLYVLLYQLSGAISGNQAVGGIASIFFLPAFVRLLGFLIIGYWIVPTLFVAGTILVATGAYNLGPGYAAEMIVTAFTAVGGPLGVYATSNFAKLNPSLSNLTPIRLLWVSLGCSAGNAVFYHTALAIAGLTGPSALDSILVFVGDLVGTWAIIYLIKAGLTIYGRYVSR